MMKEYKDLIGKIIIAIAIIIAAYLIADAINEAGFSIQCGLSSLGNILRSN